MARRPPAHPIPRIALTGGIGSGKSTVAGLFAVLGVPVIDADVIARQLVAPGAPLLDRIRERFGPGVIGVDGALDRRALRNLVFGDAAARADLDALLHPAIREELLAQARRARGPYALLVIPLLVENGLANLADRVLVVDCEPQDQLRRVQLRDGVTLAQARAVLDAQASRQARLAVADDVIHNTGAIEDLRDQVETLHLHYRQLASPPHIRKPPPHVA